MKGTLTLATRKAIAAGGFFETIRADLGRGNAVRTSWAEKKDAPLTIKRLNSVLVVAVVGSASAGLAFGQVGEVPGLFHERGIRRHLRFRFAAIGEEALAWRGRVGRHRFATRLWVEGGLVFYG